MEKITAKCKTSIGIWHLEKGDYITFGGAYPLITNILKGQSATQPITNFEGTHDYIGYNAMTDNQIIQELIQSGKFKK